MNALPQSPAQAPGPRLDNRRIAAGVVDLAVVALVGLVLRAVGGEFTPALAAVTVAWGLFYYFVSESTWQQTLGKRLLGLRVQSTAGGVPDERAVALRTVLRVVDGIAFYLVGLLVMLRTGERRQRLGDIVGDTFVVDAAEPARPTAKSTLNARTVPRAREPEPEPGGRSRSRLRGHPTPRRGAERPLRARSRGARGRRGRGQRTRPRASRS